jgi:hypothetical protein
VKAVRGPVLAAARGTEAAWLDPAHVGCLARRVNFGWHIERATYGRRQKPTRWGTLLVTDGRKGALATGRRQAKQEDVVAKCPTHPLTLTF